MIESKGDLAKSELIALVVVLSVGGTSLAALLNLGTLVPIIAVVGFVVALPLAVVFGDRLVGGDDRPTDPLEELRARYARGEIDHDEFERRTERLVETETAEPDETPLDVERELE